MTTLEEQQKYNYEESLKESVRRELFYEELHTMNFNLHGISDSIEEMNDRLATIGLLLEKLLQK